MSIALFQKQNINGFCKELQYMLQNYVSSSIRLQVRKCGHLYWLILIARLHCSQSL